MRHLHAFGLVLATCLFAFSAFAQDLSVSADPQTLSAGTVNRIWFQVEGQNYYVATHWSVTATIHSGGTVVAASDSCNRTSTTARCSLGNMLSFTRRNLYVDVNVPLGTTSVSFEAVLEPLDLNPGNNKVSITFPAINGPLQANLVASGGAEPAVVAANENVKVIFRITNQGPAISTPFTVKIDRSWALQLLGITASSHFPHCGLARTQTWYCQVDPIAVGESAELRLQMAGIIDGEYPVTLSFDMTGSATPDPSPADNTATVMVNVTPAVAQPLAADLAVSLAAPTTNVGIGAATTFTAAIRNDGPSAAEGATVTATLPSLVELLSASAPNATCSVNGLTAFCILPKINSGATTTITLNTVARNAGTATATVTMTYAGDPNAANNTASASATITAGRGRPTRRW